MDILIKNARIADGTGNPMYYADLAVKDGKIARISKELEGAKKFLNSLESKLSNEKFVSRAPEAVVNAEREKAAKHRELIAQLEQSLAAMQKLG